MDLSVTTVAGESHVLEGIERDDTLQALRSRVADAFAIGRGTVQLSFDGRVFTAANFSQTLQDLGIGDGDDLLLIQLTQLSVMEDLSVEVVGAGTAQVNGPYIGTAQHDYIVQAFPDQRGTIFFKKVDGPECISWYGADKCWPAGWFMETRSGQEGIYFLPSDDMSCLPLLDWQVYTAENFCYPGELPAPTIEQAP